jgi:hypothetical protein
MTIALTLQKYLAASVVVTLAKTALFWFLLAIALICTIWAARAQQSSSAEAERYIKESESQWAESVANGDASVVERILADDFAVNSELPSDRCFRCPFARVLLR